MEFAKDGELVKAASFKGYILTKEEGERWYSKRITRNRLRGIKWIKDKVWITAGDANREKGHLFIKKKDRWKIMQENLPGIHRLETLNNQIWAVGKQGLMMYVYFLQ